MRWRRSRPLSLLVALVIFFVIALLLKRQAGISEGWAVFTAAFIAVATGSLVHRPSSG